MTRTSVRSPLFVCAACGYESAKWLGRCTECGTWGSVAESESARRPVAVRAARRAVGVGSRNVPVPIARGRGGAARRCSPTEVTELDRVLGGGLVAGSVTLVGGEPGMGKSTLLMQALGAHRGARRALSARVRRGVDRAGPDARRPAGRARARAVRRVGDVAARGRRVRRDAWSPWCSRSIRSRRCTIPTRRARPGRSRRCATARSELVRLAKEHDIATLLVGHVTKDGGLAGPRALEHVVDTVLSFEGDRHHALRMLRALKHRFGATDELGLMEMTASGLVPVTDPSALFLADRRAGATGSVVAAVMEGARPLCVEVQSLVVPTGAPIPRRVAQAFEGEPARRCSSPCCSSAPASRSPSQDVYASVAGGVRVCRARRPISPSRSRSRARANDCAVDADTIVIGEIGLGGEIRQVPQAPRRLAEALRLGFRRAIVPASTPDVRGHDAAPGRATFARRWSRLASGAG